VTSAGTVNSDRSTGQIQGADPVDRGQLRVGPWATAIGVFFTFLAPVFVLGAYPLKPTFVTLLGMLPIGALLLLNRDTLFSLRISLPLVGYVGWAIASISWAASFNQTFLTVRVLIPPVVAMSIVAAYLPRELFLRTLLRSMQFIVVLTIIGVVASPSGRSVAVLEGIDVSGGWRGFFGHKNVMSPAVVLATVMNFAFEKDRRVRYGIFGCAIVLMVGAQSVTGLAAFIFAVLVWLWTGLISRGDQRSRSIVRVATSLVGLVAVGLAFSIVGSLLDAFGKDVTLSGRSTIWELSWPIIGRQPIQGYGLAGPYGDLTTQTALQFLLELKFYVQHAHNAAIDLLATLGIVGLVLVLSLVVGLFRAAWNAIDRAPDLSRWALAGVLALIFMGFSENTFNPTYIMILAAMRISLMVEASPWSHASSYREVSAPLARDV
jgi:exopolysaccharide production protein ExoQ